MKPSYWKEVELSVPLPMGLKKRKEENFHDFIHSINDAPDFHDPFSDLNLFLAQEIKEHMRSCGCSKKWTGKIQEELLGKITPKFQKKFPHLRLGVSALKKSWERISYYLQQIQSEKEAITQDGKLNLSFFIKKNLNQLPPIKDSFHPSAYAQQLAVKMSECIAAVDGVRPKLDHLTKMIWSLQKHLLPNIDLCQTKSPYDECDKIDKLIIKIILDTTAKEPQISQHELEHKVKDALHSLHELPVFGSVDAMTAHVAALLSEKLFPISSMHTVLLEEQRNALFSFARRQMALCKSSTPITQHTDLVRRIMSLYALASQLPKGLSDEMLSDAVRAVYPHSKEERPQVAQSLYAFITAELALAKTEAYCHSVDHACEAIIHAYREAERLPMLQANELEFLEIAAWKFLTESEGLLEKLPYRIGHRIEEEMANTLIDNPGQSFNAAVQKTVQFFIQVKELTASKKWADIERKIHTWIIQSEMIYRSVKLDPERPLLRMIEERNKFLSHKELICDVAHSYLTSHPELLSYAPQIQQRIITLYKYTWYKNNACSNESSFDRFIKWHASSLHSQSPHLDEQRIVLLLEELCKKMLPLIPFQACRCKELLADIFAKEKNKA